MAFLDSDPIEEDLGKRVDQMSPDELASYFLTYLRARHGVALPLDGIRERAIFRALQRVYGAQDAGRIVKWTTWRYDGKYQGQHLTYSSFTKGMRWFTDRMLLELHDHLQRTAYTKPCDARELGFSTGEDLL